MNISLGPYAIKNLLETGEIRSGMVLLSTNTKYNATFTCKVDLWTYDGTERSVKNSHKPLLHSAHGS